jgi:hypothetical protein
VRGHSKQVKHILTGGFLPGSSNNSLTGEQLLVEAAAATMLQQQQQRHTDHCTTVRDQAVASTHCTTTVLKQTRGFLAPSSVLVPVSPSSTPAPLGNTAIEILWMCPDNPTHVHVTLQHLVHARSFKRVADYAYGTTISQQDSACMPYPVSRKGEGTRRKSLQSSLPAGTSQGQNHVHQYALPLITQAFDIATGQHKHVGMLAAALALFMQQPSSCQNFK